MAKHTPRTIWKPIVTQKASANLAAAPTEADFYSLRSVDADADMGLQLKHVWTMGSMGLSDSPDPGNLSVSSGFMGFFKWPIDATTPSITTIDLENRTAIFGRKLWAVQGSTPRGYSCRFKSARLRLGEELWFFIAKVHESVAASDVVYNTITQFYETQA